MNQARRCSLIGAAALLVSAAALPAAANVKLVWWNPDAGTPAFQNTYKELAAKFMELHPGITVEIDPVNEDEMADKTAAALAAGSMPDVFTYYYTTDVARHGFMLDLTPYFKRDHIDPASVWFPISLNRITYDGKYYAVPRDVGPAGIAYNKDIFDKYGVAYPGANYATTDFAADLKKLNHPKDGIYGLDDQLRGPGALEWTPLATNLDVQFTSLDGRHISGYLDSPKTLNAFAWWASLHDQGLVQPAGVSEPFYSGNTAFGVATLWDVGSIRDSDLKDWDLFPGPTLAGAPPKVWNDSVLHYIYSGSPHKEEAWELLKFLSMSPEAGKIIDKYFAFGPPMKQAWLQLSDPILQRFWRIAQYPADVANYLRTEYQGDLIQPALEQAWTDSVEKHTDSIVNLLKAAAPALQAQLDDRYAAEK